jgi:hypothetical protein
MDLGVVLQILTTVASLVTGALLASRRWRRYAYLVGLCSLPLWIALEWWYAQWFYLALNPVYFITWGVGLYRNWK